MSSGNTNTLTSSHLSVGTGGLSTSSVCNCSGFAVCSVHASNSREAVLSAEQHSLGPGAGQEEAAGSRREGGGGQERFSRQQCAWASVLPNNYFQS